MTTTPRAPFRLAITTFAERETVVYMGFPITATRDDVLITAETLIEAGRAMVVHLDEVGPTGEWGNTLTWGWQRYGA